MNFDRNNWMEQKIANLHISKEFYHHHAHEIIMANEVLKNKILNDFSSQISITPRIKSTKFGDSAAIKAEDLNKEIRKLLKTNASNNLKFEVFEDRGVFYFSSEKSSIGGFDFAYLNHEKNLYSLRNLCFGEVRYHDGISRWNNFLDKNKDLREILPDIDSTNFGKDVIYVKKETDPPLFVGEIQFGNWALVYRDFFKVLKANVQNSVDCLIYIVPTGNLENMLSDGIVTYDKTVKILEEFSKVISVPVWLIGIDITISK
jgi:hypothetical protein